MRISIAPRIVFPVVLAACGGSDEFIGDDTNVPPIDAAGVDAGTDATVDPTDCAIDLPCPVASPNRVTVCGRVLDVEDSGRVGADDVPFAVCTDQSDGGCAVDLTAYDALEFAGDPGGATPLVYESKFRDTCGRYRLVDIQRPSLGFLGLAVDDAGGADLYALTGSAFPVVSAEVRPAQRAWVMTHALDAQWTSDAVLVGESFVTRGALLAIYFDANGDPVDDVTLTEGGAAEPGNDYYFSDTDPWTRGTIDPLADTTGSNGSALKINSALVEHSGTGGGCTWESALAASIPGVLFVAPRYCQ